VIFLYGYQLLAATGQPCVLWRKFIQTTHIDAAGSTGAGSQQLIPMAFAGEDPRPVGEVSTPRSTWRNSYIGMIQRGCRRLISRWGAGFLFPGETGNDHVGVVACG
jgi:hypothetical protein